MEKWAERIKQLLDAGKPRLSQLGLAKACGRSQPSISQWFNDTDSKPATQMIMGDNLVAAAKYLGTTPEWIMTGKGPAEAPSQSAQLDPEILAEAIKLIRLTFEALGVEHNQEEDPEPTALAYAYLLKRGKTALSGENVVDFMKALRERRKGEAQHAGPGTGGAGSGHRTKGSKRAS